MADIKEFTITLKPIEVLATKKALGKMRGVDYKDGEEADAGSEVYGLMIALTNSFVDEEVEQ